MNPDVLFKNVDEARQKVYKMYNKTEKEVNEDVKTLKKWLETQPHLPEIMEDALIRNLFFTSKFSIEKTKKKIDMYYTIRSSIPDFFDYSNPKLPEMKKALDYANVCIDPHLLHGLHRVHWYSLKQSNIGSLREGILVCCNIFEIRLHEDFLIHDIHIMDGKNLTLNDAMKATPLLLMKTVAIFQKVYSFCFSALYVINAPSYVAKIAALLKGMLKAKIFERIHISENEDILKSLFEKKTLPKDYGGEGLSLQELTDIMKIKFEEYQERFDKLDKMRVREDLRPEPSDNDEILGFHGSFRQLNVD